MPRNVIHDLFWNIKQSGTNYQETQPDNYLDNPNWQNNRVNTQLINNQTTTLNNFPNQLWWLWGLEWIWPWTGGIKKIPQAPKPLSDIQPTNQPVNQLSISSATQQPQISTIKPPTYTTPKWFDPDSYLKSQIWAYGTQWQLAIEDITNAYKKTAWQLWFQQAQQRSQYQNLDLINEKVNSVMKQFEQWITSPLQIARNTWLTQEDVTKVIRWDIYKDLKLSEQADFELQKPYQQKIWDIETSKQRFLEDITTKEQRAKMILDEQTSEIQRQLDQSTSALQKMWALTQQWLSSGYQLGIQNIKDESKRAIDNLKQTYDWDNEDTLRLKSRTMEDYVTNLSRIKDVAENEANKIKLQWLSAIQEIDQRFWLASENAYNALRKVYADMDIQRNNLYRENADIYKDLNTITLQRAEAIKNIYWAEASQRYLQQEGIYTPENTSDFLNQNSENFWFYTAWTIKAVGKTFGWMGGFDIAWKINDPILAQKWGTIYNLWFDQARTINWKTYPPNRFIEIKTDDWHIIRYNHLNWIWDWLQSWDKSVIGKRVEAWDQIGLMGNSGVTSKWMDLGGWRKWTGVHLDITAYAVDSNGRRGKMYQTTDEQVQAILWWWQQQQATQQKNALSQYYPLFRSYIENEKIPAQWQLNQLWLDVDSFSQLAEQWYTQLKQQEYWLKWFDIVEPISFININPSDRTKLNQSIEKSGSFDMQIQDIINKIEEWWTERQPYLFRGRELNTDITNLVLLAKDIYDLWVLNWPDLRLMETILPNPAGISATLQWKTEILSQLKNAQKKFNNTINSKAEQYWLKKIWEAQTNKPSQNNQSLQLFIDLFK